MEFIDGCKVDDTKAIEAQGFRPKDIAKLVADTFGTMVGNKTDDGDNDGDDLV